MLLFLGERNFLSVSICGYVCVLCCVCGVLVVVVVGCVFYKILST